ncbi:protein of unknown function (DUF3067) [Rubidibacter lacunae KORDI 51-2]|uniref:DUF3067 domain-containing protein n=1 Tax=Rubidibacter lacunae KORDI 51-2 TaxID=582515 RepID=U5DKM1_9CHRO|nr:DUF3067 family protein [Rubidibacter lacunae]ERN40265.1 protein of unknown function (DUF3067) [Rubidibacter lacunae KORDI 51-2]
MTGRELQQLLVAKWGRSFDVQLRRVRGRIFVQVMWRYAEQVSFPLSETEYLDRLDTIAAYLEALGGAAQFADYLISTRERPRLGKAVSVPLELGDRASEWLLDEV